MGRRKVDPAFRETYDQIRTILNPTLSDFLYESQVLDILLTFFRSWENKGFPVILEDRNVMVNEEEGTTLYEGLYYDLFEVCDAFKLRWPQGGRLLVQTMILRAEVGKYSDLELPHGLPPKLHWRWFRMARTGLSAPRKNELKGLRRVSSTGRRFKIESGLTYELIAEIHTRETDERMSTRVISQAVKACWDYLNSGVNIDKVVAHGRYTELEYWILLVAIALRNFENHGRLIENLNKSDDVLEWEQELEKIALSADLMGEV